MNNKTTTLDWGLTPIPDGEFLAVWGARAIFVRREISLLPNRQQMFGHQDARNELCDWINHVGLPKLKRHVEENHWDGATEETFTIDDWPIQMKASPRRSHGYMYLTATMRGEEKFPDGKWSNTFIPQIGETVKAKCNDIGKCKVLGYMQEAGWNAIVAKPLKPPKWFVKQNGKYAFVMLFGAEFERSRK